MKYNLKRKAVNDNESECEQIEHLTEECNIVEELLEAFNENEINSLVVLEKEGEAMRVMSNGLSYRALVALLLDIFYDDLKLHRIVTEILRDSLKSLNINLSDKGTVH